MKNSDMTKWNKY